MQRFAFLKIWNWLSLFHPQIAWYDKHFILFGQPGQYKKKREQESGLGTRPGFRPAAESKRRPRCSYSEMRM